MARGNEAMSPADGPRAERKRLVILVMDVKPDVKEVEEVDLVHISRRPRRIFSTCRFTSSTSGGEMPMLLRRGST